jgi:hypothetical protein
LWTIFSGENLIAHGEKMNQLYVMNSRLPPYDNEDLAKIAPDNIGSFLELAFPPAEGVFPCSCK